MADTDGNQWVLLDTDLTTRLAMLLSAVSHLYFVLNEPGSGALNIPLESNSAALVESGMFAQANYRGAARGGFFVDNIEKMHASEGGGQWLSISGRGGLALLEDAIIWDDGTTATTRDFADVTKASILITLIDEAQARGSLAALTYDFDAALDSDGVAWTDSENYTLNVATSLLEVLRQFAKTGIDFDIVYSGGGFVLSAYKNGKGTEKSETIYFRTGKNCEEVKSDERGDGIKNALRVAFKSGNITIKDDTSITNRRRREKGLDARVAQTSESASTYGSAILANSKDPKKGIAVKIYDGVSPRVFVDYDLGDYITLDTKGVETRYRVLGIQCDWDGRQYSNVVVELNSLLYENDIRLAQDVDRLLNQWDTARDANLLEARFWAAIGAANDNASSVNAFAVSGNYLYVGGLFSLIGGIASTNIARYDMSTGVWSAVGSLLGTDRVKAICIYDGYVYYGGDFQFVYQWDGTTQTSIGSFVDAASVYAMATDGTYLYVGGNFTDINGIARGSIAKWDGAWSSLDATIFYTVYSLLYSGGNLYAGGTFPEKVKKWNGTAWSSLASGLGDTVYSLAEYGTGILAGGLFTGGISEWNGSSWTTIGGGVNAVVNGIAVYLTDIYITGAFTDVGTRVAKYSGGGWSELTTGINDIGYAIALNDSDVYVGGLLTLAGDKTVVRIAAYFTDFQSVLDYLENSSNNFDMGQAIHNATASAISDADEIPFWEDVTAKLRKITWANIKATLKTYFDTLYLSLTSMSAANALDLTDGGATTLHTHAGGGGTPGGSDTQIQFNDATAFGGDADLTWDKTNNVLNIGGTPPSAAASSVNQDASGVSVGHFLWTHGATFASYLTGVFSRGTNASPTQSLLGDIALKLRGRWYDDSTYGNTAAEIRFIANQDQTTTAHGAKIEIHTTPDGSTTLTKALTIGADGNVNIETGKTYNINGTPIIGDAIADGVLTAPTQNAVFDALALKESLANKNAVNGYVGLDVLYKIQFLNGDASYTSKIVNNNTAARTYTFPDKNITVAGTDVATTSAAGLALQATAPASGLMNFVGLANGETAYLNKPLFDTTNPAAVGTAAPGTQLIAARRDHVHAPSATVKGRLFLPFSTYSSISPMTTTAVPFAVTIDRAMTLISWAQHVYVHTNASGNNSSNYWVLSLERQSDSAQINQISTVAISAGTNTVITDTSFANNPLAASNLGIYILCSKVGTPGDLYMFGPLIEAEL